jgi:hypothetical protein
MSTGAAWLDKAMWDAKRFKEPDGASEFGLPAGEDAHAHGKPPPQHRGYPRRYVPITPPSSPDEISIGSNPRGTGGVP